MSGGHFPDEPESDLCGYGLPPTSWQETPDKTTYTMAKPI